MSKHSVPGGDFAGLMERFAQLQEKAKRRTGQSSIQRRWHSISARREASARPRSMSRSLAVSA